MALIDCPECTRSVSERASACPQCGFPIAEHVARQQATSAAAADRETRRHEGTTDCVACDARGFRMLEFTDEDGETRDGFMWCEICSHSGRVLLCRSERGYWAVASVAVEAFVSGGDDESPPNVVFLGTDPPPPHRYPKAGPTRE